jgi:hypothetical protein
MKSLILIIVLFSYFVCQTIVPANEEVFKFIPIYDSKKNIIRKIYCGNFAIMRYEIFIKDTVIEYYVSKIDTLQDSVIVDSQKFAATSLRFTYDMLKRNKNKIIFLERNIEFKQDYFLKNYGCFTPKADSYFQNKQPIIHLE